MDQATPSTASANILHCASIGGGATHPATAALPMRSE